MKRLILASLVVAPALLVVPACKPTKGLIPEVQVLSRLKSPDGQHEARLYRIIGGPEMGGAVVWQELRITPPGAPLPQGPNSTIALSSGSEFEAPAFSFTWVSPTSLVVSSGQGVPVRIVQLSIDGVQIQYTPR